MVKIAEAAKILEVSKDTLRRWEAAGKIHSRRTPSGYRDYELTELERVKRGAPTIPSFPPTGIPEHVLAEPGRHFSSYPEIPPLPTIQPVVLESPKAPPHPSIKKIVWGVSTFAGISATLTLFLIVLYLTTPKAAQIASTLGPLNSLAQSIISTALPEKAKELGLSSNPSALSSNLPALSSSSPQVLAASTPTSTYLEFNTDVKVNGNLTANNILNSLKAGTNISIDSTDSNNPTINATFTLPANLVRSIGTLSGDITLGNGLSISNNILSNSATLSDIRTNGGCSSCLTDSDVTDSLTLSGGTVNSTPIGASSPSTGAFTSLSTTGALTLQSSSHVYSGAGAPSNSLGSDGDYYFNSSASTSSTSVYVKLTGAWTPVGSGIAVINAQLNGSAVGTNVTTLNFTTPGFSITESPAGTDNISLGGITGSEIANTTITDSNISSSAAIAYSKLNLSGSITSSDLASTTGSGAVVLATSPTLTTPTLGAATATTINKVAITQPATGATLTIADGKTLTASNTLTLAGTDSTTFTFPAVSGTVLTDNVPNTIQVTSNADVPLSLKPVASTGTGHVLDIYNNAATPALTSYFDSSGLFNGSGAGISAGTISNTSLASSAISLAYGTGLSGSASVSLGGTLTLNNTGVTSNVAGTDITISGGTGAVTINDASTLSSVSGRGASTTTTLALNGGLTSTSSTPLSLNGTNPSISTSGSNYLNLSANSATLNIGGVSGNVGIGTTSPAGLLDISKSLSGTGTMTGPYLSISSSTYTASSNSDMAFNSIAVPTLAASSAQTTTNAYTLYIAGAPTAGTNETITNSYAFGVNGNVFVNGTVTSKGSSEDTLTLTPSTDTTALTLVGTNVLTQKLAYFNAHNQSGTIFGINYGTSQTLNGSLTGIGLDLSSTNLTATNESVTGEKITLPTVTNTNTTGTENLTGYQVDFGSGGGINQTGAGSTVFSDVDLSLPALTQSSGSLTANGVNISTPSSITTGGTANGINIAATGVGAGSLNGINFSTISSPGAGTETALSVGSGWDSILSVNGTTDINGSGVALVAGGGTGQNSYTDGDMLYYNSSTPTQLTKLSTGGAANSGKVLVINGSGIPSWGTASGGAFCGDCVFTDPTTSQTIQAAGGSATTTTPLIVKGVTSQNADIFDVESSTGTKYFYVDKNGAMNIGTGQSGQTLTLTPPDDTQPALTLVGTNVVTNDLEKINFNNQSGNVLDILNSGSGQTLTAAGTLTGINENLSTNITSTNASVGGLNITLPGATNTSGTQTLRGLVVTGGAINENGGTSTTFSGADITIPALTQTSGSLFGYGVNITTPSSITTGGTAAGININASGVGAGSLYGLNISGITGGSGTETGLAVGSGWDYAATFMGNVGIGTTSPTTQFQISGTAGQNLNPQLTAPSGFGTFLDLGAASGNYTELEGDSSGNFLLNAYGGASGVFQSIRSGAVANTLVLKAGDVGVGTTSPLDKLQVNGGSGGGIMIGSGYDSGVANYYIGSPRSSDGNFGQGSFINFLTYLEGGVSGHYSAGIDLGTNQYGVGEFTTMSLRAGKIGIGTSSPGQTLSVLATGNTTITGPTSGTWAGSFVNAQDGSGYDGLSVQNRWAASDSTIFEAAMGWNGSTSGYYPVFDINGLGDLIWKTNTGTVLADFVNSSGAIGIGNTPPAGFGILMQGDTISGDGGNNAAGIAVNATYATSVTNVGSGVEGVGTVTANPLGEWRDFYAPNPNVSGSGTITTAKGLAIDSITRGGTNNYGIYINAPSGGSGDNIGLYNAGTSYFGNSVGVGITNPTIGKLELSTSGDNPYLDLNTTSSTDKRTRINFSQNGTVGMEIGTDYNMGNTNDLYIYNRASGGIAAYFNPGSNVWLSARGTNSDFYENSSGQIGIGTTSPGDTLTVVGGIRVGDSSTLSGTANDLTVRRAGADSIPYLSLINEGTVTQTIASGGTSHRQDLVFSNDDAGNYIFNTGNVGIGTTTPGGKLEVYQSSGVSTLKITAAGSTNSDYPAISFSRAGAEKWQEYVEPSSNNLYFLDSPNSDNQAVIRADASALDDEGFATGTVDYAEFMPKVDINESINTYDVVGIKDGKVTKDTQGATMYMVSSTNSGIRGGNPLDTPRDNDPDWIPVAYIGQMPVIVDGSVNEGDYIIPSGNNDGRAIAVSPSLITPSQFNQIVGIALEGSINPYYEQKSYSTSSDSEVERALALMQQRKGSGHIINIVVGTDHNLPQQFLNVSQDGSLITSKLTTGTLQLSGVESAKLQTVEDSLDPTTLQEVGDAVNSGSDSTHVDLATTINTILAAQENEQSSIKNLEDQVAGVATQSAQLKDSLASLQNDTASTSAQLASLSQQTASTSATLASLLNQSLTDPDTIEATTSATLADIKVTDTTSTLKLDSIDATVSGTLNVLTQANLPSTSIAGDFSVDGTLSLSGNSLNSVGLSTDQSQTGVLYIQNSPLASLVDFFNGLVTIDNSGNLSINRLTVSSKSAGTTTIKAGQTSVTVSDATLTNNSKIFTSPNQPVAVAVSSKDSTHNTFTLTLSQPLSSDLEVDWWIVDQKQ